MLVVTFLIVIFSQNFSIVIHARILWEFNGWMGFLSMFVCFYSSEIGMR